MIDPTPAALAPLVADDLSYGHSGGRVDTKDSFIGDLVAGKSDFVTIAITDQSIKVVGNSAIVRHTLTADTNDSGKPGKVQIKILGVWQQQGGSWKLLARQAVRFHGLGDRATLNHESYFTLSRFAPSPSGGRRPCGGAALARRRWRGRALKAPAGESTRPTSDRARGAAGVGVVGGVLLGQGGEAGQGIIGKAQVCPA
eukprot:gene36142-59190_t